MEHPDSKDIAIWILDRHTGTRNKYVGTAIAGSDRIYIQIPIEPLEPTTIRSLMRDLMEAAKSTTHD